MKVNFKYAMMTIAALTMGLTSCSNDNEVVDTQNEETQNLSIRIAQPEMSRAVAGPEANKANPVVFSDGELLLCNASGKILDVYAFSSTLATDLSLNRIAIGDAIATNGVTITNVDGDVRSAYIVGNSGAIKTVDNIGYSAVAKKGEYISSVKAYTVTPVMQYNATNKDLANVTLWGEGTLVPDPSVAPTDPAKKYVEITLRPHVARLEIADVTAVPNTTGVSITQYDVKGIYINKYYPTLSLDARTPAAIVNSGQGGTTVYGDNQGVYASALKGILYDYSTTYFGNTTTTALTKYPNGTNNVDVWAYNLLAAPVIAGDAVLATATTLAPQVIVEVENVQASNSQSYANMRYITVGKLIDATTSTTITHFEAGKIYTIDPGSFEFDVDGVKDDANVGKIDLRVKVSLITWTTVGMKPEIQ
ncbi:hypothetical protein [Bacteroides sp. 224]|uniref:hypothetical protein n=1 Tax=Bacteroides sp. 224 TaxID=2302936 RepID=UPI0013D12474|nr:hypothetical protein [Bacteroides sp. 224]NDV67124.1 hypothetical protein [Bacteroides sp. 224]